MLSELEKVRKRLDKAKAKVTSIKEEETAILKDETIRCENKTQPGTLFEETCNFEMRIGDTTLYRLETHETVGNSYDNERHYYDGYGVICPICKTKWKWKEPCDYMVNRSPYFKEVKFIEEKNFWKLGK